MGCIDALHGAREVQVGKIPDLFGAVAKTDFVCRAAPVPLTIKIFARRDSNHIAFIFIYGNMAKCAIKK